MISFILLSKKTTKKTTVIQPKLTLWKLLYLLSQTPGALSLNQWRTAQEHRVWQVICGNFCGLRCGATAAELQTAWDYTEYINSWCNDDQSYHPSSFPVKYAAPSEQREATWQVGRRHPTCMKCVTLDLLKLNKSSWDRTSYYCVAWMRGVSHVAHRECISLTRALFFIVSYTVHSCDRILNVYLNSECVRGECEHTLKGPGTQKSCTFMVRQKPHLSNSGGISSDFISCKGFCEDMSSCFGFFCCLFSWKQCWNACHHANSNCNGYYMVSDLISWKAIWMLMSLSMLMQIIV